VGTRAYDAVGVGPGQRRTRRVGKYRITLEIDAADDDGAMAVGREQARKLAGSKFVGVEIERAYYWEPVFVEAPARKQDSAA
jgi:hypothetical protein